jgi:hypothetical protein
VNGDRRRSPAFARSLVGLDRCRNAWASRLPDTEVEEELGTSRGRLFMADVDGDGVISALLGTESRPAEKPDEVVAQVRVCESYSHLPQREVKGPPSNVPLRL